MPVWLQSSVVILFAYCSCLLVKRGAARLLWFGEVNRQVRPVKFWFVVTFMALMGVGNALLVIAKVS